MILNIGNSSNTLKVVTLDNDYPKDASCTVGTVVTFNVIVTSFGYPANCTYQWYLNDAPVAGATDTSFSHYRSIEGTDTVYCVVTNEAGTVKSRTATLQANRLYLYNAGNQCADVTGGWVAALSGANSNEGYVNSLTHTSENMYILGRRNEYDGAAGTGWLVDLSKHTRLNAIVSSTARGSYMRVTSTLNYFYAETLASMEIPTTATTISLDISNLSAGHIVFDAKATDTEEYATWVAAVWLG